MDRLYDIAHDLVYQIRLKEDAACEKSDSASTDQSSSQSDTSGEPQDQESEDMCSSFSQVSLDQDRMSLDGDEQEQRTTPHQSPKAGKPQDGQMPVQTLNVSTPPRSLSPTELPPLLSPTLPSPIMRELARLKNEKARNRSEVEEEHESEDASEDESEHASEDERPPRADLPPSPSTVSSEERPPPADLPPSPSSVSSEDERPPPADLPASPSPVSSDDSDDDMPDVETAFSAVESSLASVERELASVQREFLPSVERGLPSVEADLPEQRQPPPELSSDRKSSPVPCWTPINPRTLVNTRKLPLKGQKPRPRASAKTGTPDGDSSLPGISSQPNPAFPPIRPDVPLFPKYGLIRKDTGELATPASAKDRPRSPTPQYLYDSYCPAEFTSAELEALAPDFFTSIMFLERNTQYTVWLVRFKYMVPLPGLSAPPGASEHDCIHALVIRLPLWDASHPHAIINEFSFRKFMNNNLEDIPIPYVYHWNVTEDPRTSYILEEYVRGEPLSNVFESYNKQDKMKVCKQLADILIEMLQVTAPVICSVTTSRTIAPPVEACRLYKNRWRMCDYNSYHLGPYKTVREYVLACYDKEICFYKNAKKEEIDMEPFEQRGITVEQFLEKLKDKRREIAHFATEIKNEPFGICHGDFHGRNILVRNAEVVGILNWQFAGFYPISEVMSSDYFEIIGVSDKHAEALNWEWAERVRSMMMARARARGIAPAVVDLICCGGTPEIVAARQIMDPSWF